MSRSKSYDKEIVLEKAMEVFWNYGYEATSVRMLEKEMGINQFSIYNSFSNKKNLFIESLKKYREFVKINYFNDLCNEEARLENLKLFFMQFEKSIRKNDFIKGCLVVNTASEFGNKDPEIIAEIDRYFNFIKQMIMNVLSNSLKAGDISPSSDLDKISNYLLGIMQGLSVGAKVLNQNQINDFIETAFSGIT